MSDMDTVERTQHCKQYSHTNDGRRWDIKIARLRIQETGAETYGIVKEDRVSTMEEIRRSAGIPVPPDVLDFMFRGWADEIESHSSKLEYGQSLAECELLPPIPRPPKILCAAFNYTTHAAKHNTAAERGGPVVIMKPATALCGAGANIVCPSFVRKLDYETELAVIIGKKTKNASAAEAADAIFGYMVLNDVSARDIQFSDGQFTRAKGFDTFAPCGPWITTRDEAGDWESLRIRTSVNGELRQDSPASAMTTGPERMISELSHSMTLECGDILSTGTPGGTVLDCEDCEYLGDGDIIVSDIQGLGKLTNRVVFVG